MKWRHIIIGLIAVTTLTGWSDRSRDLQWPHAGPMPDDPVKVKPLRYKTITKGNQSYRPIDPMPWGDVNERVMPKGSDAAPSSVAPPAAAPALPGPARPTSPGIAPAKRVPPAAAPNHGTHGAAKP